MKISAVFSNNIYTSARGVIKRISSPSFEDAHREVIVVPDRFSLLAEKMVFEEKGIDCTFFIEVTTLSRLSSKILEECGDNSVVLSKIKMRSLIRKAIIDCQSEFLFFKNRDSNLDFANALLDTISQLKSSGLGIRDVEKLSKNCETTLEKKLHDVFLVFERYEHLISFVGIDASDLVSLAIKKAGESEYVKDSSFSFVGFEGMTKQGYEMLKKIVEASRSVTIGLIDCPPDQKNKFIFDGEMFDVLKNISILNNIIIESVYVPLDNLKANAILSNAYLFTKTPTENFDFARVFQAQNTRQEVEEVAKSIKEKIVKNGLRFKDISVACGNVEDYKSTIKDVFQNFDIPCFIDENKTMDTLLPAKFLNIVISTFKSGFWTDDILALISSSFIDVPKTIKNQIIKLIENYSLCGDAVFDSEDILPDEIKNDFINIFQPLKKYSNINKIFNKIDYFIDFINYLIKYFEIEEKIERYIKIFEQTGELEISMIYAQSMESLSRALDEINEPDVYGEISFEEFCQIFESAISSIKISTVPVSVDRVFVGDATSSFYDQSKVLFVIGANSDKLPKTQIDCGLISDKEIISMDCEGQIGPMISIINFRNRQKLLSVFGTVGDNVVLSYVAVGEDGRQKFPSRIVGDVLQTFQINGMPILVEDITNENHLAENLVEGFQNKLIRNFSSKTSAKISLLKILKQEDKRVKKLANSIYFALGKSGEKIVFEAKKKPDYIHNAEKLFFPKGKTQSSQLETYFKCPYMHFAKYGLRLQENREKNVDALEIGNILHECVEMFTKTNVAKLKEIENKQVEELANETYNKVVSKKQYKYFITHSAFDAVLSLLKKENIRVCQKIVEEQKLSNFSPKFFEKEFGFNLQSCTSFETRSGFVGLSGKVDRIDMCMDGFRIIDYKTGNVDDMLKDVFFGSKIQLFLYANEWESATKKKCKGVFYFPISNKIGESNNDKIFSGFFDCDLDNVQNMDSSLNLSNPTSKIINVKLKTNKKNLKSNTIELRGGLKGNLTKDQLKSLMKYCEQVAKQAVVEIASGYISPSPANDGVSVCEFCDYKSMCGFEDESKTRKLSLPIGIESFQGGGKND